MLKHFKMYITIANRTIDLGLRNKKIEAGTYMR